MTEINKLIKLLDSESIPYEIEDNALTSTPQIFYPCTEDPICDVICHQYSYGGPEGLLEIMGLVEGDADDVEGWLTAKTVFARISKDYHSRKLS